MDYLRSLLDSLCPPKRPKSASVPKLNSLMTNFTCDSNLVRLAGLSGALAISFGAFGSHALRENGNVDERRLRAFDTGNRYHLIHSIALLGASKSRFPWLTAALLLGGMTIFSGSCYHYSITGKETMRKYTPFGGLMYILAWLSFLI
ncbi:unnamed protein product [Thelazia callipaeda]|uniref:Transmembrane protein 256 homolog n=1 Tax=Thelazia callipaeda TaxID=103827 RepID=A0A0N5CQX0_THECL|nr:unnamed protein product [Thelazia callipaeda]